MPKIKPPKPTTPTCAKKGWLWVPGLQCCSQGKPPSPPTSVPSPKPKSKKDDDKKDWHDKGKDFDKKDWEKDFHKKDWSKEYKEKHGYDKVKRNFDDWDASFCPTGLTTCPIISNGVFTGDSEW